ncbi:NAD(P)-dependent oxidoreductase [Candidatus Wolfebacteria bacterium]|nr:NAD(P)-dependent oxidoreductase [Candidatus Wolfebacteria bacterium]
MLTRILITGATGFIGSNLVRRLIGQNENNEVHILTRDSSNIWRIADIIKKIHNHSIDLLEAKKLKRVLTEIRPDYVFHLANAGVYAGVSVSDKELVKVNFIGLINLISSLERVNYKGFINVGSSSEYGLKNKPIKENDLCDPINIYGISKLAASCYASFIARSKDKPIITLRLFSPFGPYDDHRRLISKLILNLEENKELILINPDSVRDYIFVNDIIDLFLEAKDKANILKGEIFNVAIGQECKISEIANLIISIINPEIKVKWEISASSFWEPKKWQADMTKTFSSFDWRPHNSLKQGIDQTIKWFLKNKSLYKNFIKN